MPADPEHMQYTDFIAYAGSRIARLREDGRYDAATKLEGYIRRLTSYLGRDTVPFREFDARLVHGYRAWLEGRGLGRNTVSLYIRSLKRVYRLAVEEGLTAECNPFDGKDVSYRVRKKRNGLSLDEVKRLRDLDLEGEHPSVVFARDIFLFSVYARGMRSDDIFRLTRENIRDGRLVYRRRLTGREVSFPWEPALREIAGRYERPDTPLLLPVVTAEDPLVRWKQYDSTLRSINRGLKKLGRMIGTDCTLNMTVAHHSWESMTGSVNVGDLL